MSDRLLREAAAKHWTFDNCECIIHLKGNKKEKIFRLYTEEIRLKPFINAFFKKMSQPVFFVFF